MCNEIDEIDGIFLGFPERAIVFSFGLVKTPHGDFHRVIPT